MVRSKDPLPDDAIYWDPLNETLNRDDFENFDAVIHLAGRNIAAKKWSKSEKELIFRSRCRDTWVLSQVLSRVHHPPKVFISASAVGLYGDRQDEVVTEVSNKGEGFLSDLSAEWEKDWLRLLALLAPV